MAKRARLQAIPQAKAFNMTPVGRDRIAYAPGCEPNSDGVNGSAPYTCPELRATVRPGANDAQAHPSRIGNRLSYRDGRLAHTMHGVRHAA